MLIDNIRPGKTPPADINVVIEIPAGGEPIKYEFDKDSGALFVDRIVHTSMRYPAHYGFIPRTMAKDGDPLDVLVYCSYGLIPGVVINCRPVGVLHCEDEKGGDSKIVAVPSSKVIPFYDRISDIKDLPELFISQIMHFFSHYKDLEPGKWVKVNKEFGDAKEAQKLIISSLLEES